MIAAGDPRRSELRTESWQALGTTAVLRYAGPPDPAVREAVEREIEAIDLAASRFRADSELTGLNVAAEAGGGRRRISPLLLEALELAVRAAVVSDGTVDPALGDWMIVAGYDRDWGELTAVAPGVPLHSDDRIVVQRRRADWRDIELTREPPTVRIPAGVTLDLGATAKALAADRAAAAAYAAGDAGVLVSLGGDIGTCGPAPDAGWQIHVTDDHRDGPDAPGQTIAIGSGGLATSSLVARRWRHDGQTMHHILDPRDGAPVQSPWRTVSVAAATCADANIASTAAIVLGADAPRWMTDHGLPARLVALDGTVVLIGDWPA
jgi:FAD:protein FMN transferase